MSQGTGGYGGASMAIPGALLVVCFPKIALALLLVGLVILIASATVWLIFGEDV